ncbi:MAG: hypothetical protein APR55_08160 [Methanolinea sp. SDB]|nr:MAG: hypothetical protein APR55_08160 [Methanolinea sp. SDB]
MKLSKHFIDNWRKRVSDEIPTVDDVREIIRGAVRVQRGKELLFPDGSPFRQLAIWWSPSADLIIKVDTKHNTVVSVLGRINQ